MDLWIIIKQRYIFISFFIIIILCKLIFTSLHLEKSFQRSKITNCINNNNLRIF